MSALIDIHSSSSSPSSVERDAGVAGMGPAMLALKGDVRFVTQEERTGLHGAITPRGLLAVEIGEPPWFPTSATLGGAGARHRGKLREAIEWAIESALEINDAPPAGIGDAGDLDQALSDQLFRARSIGARGVALYFPDLGAAGNLAGALDAEDSAVLRWWIAATGDRPVMILLDVANRGIGAYGPPTRLEGLVDAARGARRGDANSSVVTFTGATTAPSMEEPVEPTGHAPKPEQVEPTFDATDREQEAGETTTTTTTTTTTNLAADEAPPLVTSPPPPPDDHGPTLRVVADSNPNPVKELFADRIVPLFPRREPLPAKSAAFADRTTAVAASLDWRGFANELEVARGPKPLTIVERLFMSRYVPLVDAVARGEADDAARRTAERWAENFARSYTEGFGAFKVTGKRPRMVLDAPQIGSQIARLHGAKSTHLVLVDAMRFDLGIRVHDRMRDALTSQATCTERLLLWSALPTITPTQLDLLAHGPEALASPTTPSEREEPGLRGRTSTTLRRVKIGGRDIMKLDVVESRLRESGGALGERLDSIAEEVASALALHARNLAPRTLMFVFGDHGFRLEGSEGGTLAATQGGASPEEVLVPAFAWLIGDVH